MSGKVFKYGDNIDTDIIIPARHLNIADMRELAKYAFIDADTKFAQDVQKGDYIAAGFNFGCGSSREHAPLVLKELGIKCVIAKSFARIFYRNAINIGLPILECEKTNQIETGDLLTIDFESGIITNDTKKEQYISQPFPPFMTEIIKSGGLVRMTKNRLGEA